jgi:DNA-binding protein HU-beta
MNKAKLIEQMSKMSKLPKATCKKAVESFIRTVGQTLKIGKSVVLTGFGSFTVAKRKSRMQIPAKKVAKFKAGKALRDLVSSV